MAATFSDYLRTEDYGVRVPEQWHSGPQTTLDESRGQDRLLMLKTLDEYLLSITHKTSCGLKVGERKGVSST